MKLYIAGIAVILSLALAVFALKQRVDVLGLELDLASKRATQLEEMISKTREISAKRDRIDAKYVKELSRAKSEINDLRVAVSDGAKRLRVKASCSSVSGDSSGSGLDDGVFAELDISSRSDYFALRESLVLTEKRLAGLQEYVKNVCVSGLVSDEKA